MNFVHSLESEITNLISVNLTIPSLYTVCMHACISLSGGFSHALHPASSSQAPHYNGHTCYGNGSSDWEEHLIEEIGDGKS